QARPEFLQPCAITASKCRAGNRAAKISALGPGDRTRRGPWMLGFQPDLADSLPGCPQKEGASWEACPPSQPGWLTSEALLPDAAMRTHLAASASPARTKSRDRAR